MQQKDNINEINDGFEHEDTKDNDESEGITIPFNPKDVDIQVLPGIMDLIIKRLKNDEINLSPDFQRSADLWKKTQQSRLIESLLIKLPIPAFYFDAITQDSWEVVDGLQRLTSIKNFVIDNKLSLTGLEFLENLNGKTFNDLPRPYQRLIEEATVTIYLIKPGTPLKMKYSLFKRINTGGLSLNPQEIRHAINQSINDGRASTFLTELSEESCFTKIVKTNKERMLNKELILRHLSFMIRDVKDYKSSMIKFLDESMELLGQRNIDDLELLRVKFKQAMELAFYLFGEHAFKKSFSDSEMIKVVNKPLFESLSVAFAKLDESQVTLLKKNKDLFIIDYNELMKNKNFNDSISNSTANTDKVGYRMNKTDSLVSKFARKIL